jgi:hypothetical protein
VAVRLDVVPGPLDPALRIDQERGAQHPDAGLENDWNYGEDSMRLRAMSVAWAGENRLRRRRNGKTFRVVGDSEGDAMSACHSWQWSYERFVAGLHVGLGQEAHDSCNESQTFRP